MDTKPTIPATKRLPRQQKGAPPLMLSRTITNVVLGICEAVLNLKVVVPFQSAGSVLSSVEAKVDVTEMGCTVTMPPLPMPSNNSWPAYKGTYDNTLPYAAGQLVRVLTTTTISGVSVPAGLYAVVPPQNVPANGTGNQIPQYPEPATGTVYWHCLVLYCP